MAAEVTHFTLNTGAKIPAVGFGTWQAGKSWEPGSVGKAVGQALDAGYRHIDTAQIYLNQSDVGEGLQKAFAKGLKREEVFITTKLWPSDFNPADVEPAIKKALGELQLSYVDLFLLHWPFALNKDFGFPPGPNDLNASVTFVDTWRAMEDIYAKGLVKAIGVSNFTVKHLETLLASDPKVVPAVNQVEVHPSFRQSRLKAFCAEKGIHVSAYAPLGSPERPEIIHEIYTETPPRVLDLPAVKAAAEATGKTPGQVLLRWGLENGHSVLPKSTHPERIKQNLELSSWQLPEESRKALDALDVQVRLFPGPWFGEDRLFKAKEDLFGDEFDG